MKTTKKMFLALAVLSVAACSASAFSACGEHEHEWGDWSVTTEATCETAGKKERVCAGDPSHKEEEAIPALEHNYGAWTEKTPATCTEAKVEEHVCSYDATHKETRTVGEALGHTWDDGAVTTQPMEDTPGVRTYKCTVSGCDGSKTEPVSELGHDWGDWTEKTPATCMAAKVEERVCSHDATHKETRTVGEANPEAHSWGEWTSKTAATCIAPAVEERVCAHNPAHTETKNVGEVNPEAHAWGEWEVTTKPKDGQTGTATRTCSRSGCEETQEKTLPSLSTAGVYTVTGDTATCEEAGTANYQYAFDGGEVSFTAETKATGHKWSEWLVNINDDGGEASKWCQNDGCQAYKHTDLPALSEKEQYQYEDSSTCEMPGNEVYIFVYSDDDGSEYIQVKNEEAPAKGHSFGEWETKSEADCTHAAVEERKCENKKCDESETRTGEAASGHDWSNNPVQDEAKNTFTWTCANNCGETDVVEYHATQGSSVTAAILVPGRTEYLYNTAAESKTVGLVLSGINMPDIGIYTFEIRYVDKGAYPITPSSRNTVIINNGNKIYLSKNEQDGYSVVNTYKDNVWIEVDEYNRITNVRVFVDGTTFTAGAKFTLALQKTLAAGETGGVLFTMKEGNKIYYGDNQINVTEAGATADSSTDTYTFVPTEDATYSMTVPEGVVVLMDGEDLITNKNWANFEVTNGTPVTFTFLASKKGVYTATIGEEIPNTIIFNEKTSSPVPGNKPATYVVAEDAEEKEYTLIVTPALAIRQYMYVIINDTKVSFAANGNLVKSDDAENAKYIYLGIGNQTGSNAQEGWSYTCPRLSREFTIKLTLKAGDTVSFITSGGGECEFTLIDSAD